MKKVVVTGIGAVTPLGNSFGQTWIAAKSGSSGIERITKFDTSHLPWKAAGELKGFDPKIYLSEKEMQRFDPFVQYAIAAAVMTAEDSGLLPSDSSLLSHYSPLSCGVIIGSSRGGISTIERSLVRPLQYSVKEEKDRRVSALKQHARLRLSPYTMPSSTVSMAASSVAQRLGISGYCLGISNACASGSNAVGEAFRLIRSGHLRLAVAGGAEAPICRVCVEGYGIMGALSRDTNHSQDLRGVPRPFDRLRDGFVLSEGACVLLLEDYESALKRAAKVYGEITGYGNTTDSFHMTRPHPHGEAEAMLKAIKEAGVTPGDVDYINTHGTATQIGDIAEALSIKMVFGKRASTIPATAVKSMTGHMLAGSGALETALTLMTMREGIIPPTINIDGKDPACDINIVTAKRDADIRVALSNSFGFGGVNAVLALRRTEQ